jgi:hypothetical protein
MRGAPFSYSTVLRGINVNKLHYMVVKDYPGRFDRIVAALLADGWKLQGGVSAVGDSNGNVQQYAQALVMEVAIESALLSGEEKAHGT